MRDGWRSRASAPRGPEAACLAARPEAERRCMPRTDRRAEESRHRRRHHWGHGTARIPARCRGPIVRASPAPCRRSRRRVGPRTAAWRHGVTPALRNSVRRTAARRVAALSRSAPSPHSAAVRSRKRRAAARYKLVPTRRGAESPQPRHPRHGHHDSSHRLAHLAHCHAARVRPRPPTLQPSTPRAPRLPASEPQRPRTRRRAAKATPQIKLA